MSDTLIDLCILVGAVLLFCLCILYALHPASSSAEARAPFVGRNYAHRGLHDREKGVPENSPVAFRAAVEAGYGVELDVQLSSDGQVVVFHDDTLDRVCGIKGRVDAYTLEELQSFPLFGTAERIPLFTEVLAILDAKIPVIVELKHGADNEQLCKKTLALLNAYAGAYCVESFDPYIVRWFYKNAPHILRGQLTEPYGGWRKYNSLSRSLTMAMLLPNHVTHPQFIAFGPGKRNLFVRLCRGMGALFVYWTARDPADHARLAADNDAVIFEGYRPNVRND